MKIGKHITKAAQRLAAKNSIDPWRIRGTWGKREVVTTKDIKRWLEEH